jgi:hypothetical protein
VQENTNPPSHTNAKTIKMFVYTTVISLAFIIIIIIIISSSSSRKQQYIISATLYRDLAAEDIN